MRKNTTEARDRRYREMLLEPLRTCASYVPAMGQGRSGTTLAQFHSLYGADPFYHWIGMDSAFMYAAHKAAGGMTSVYRQLGTGGERLVRAIIRDELGLTNDQIDWSYTIERSDGTTRTLTLDARLDYEFVNKHRPIIDWTEAAARKLGFSEEMVKILKGSVFEIRQGYKSQDAKRQNADMQSAMRARNDGYVFGMAVLSTQISNTLRRRYQNSQMLVLVGNLSGDPLDDTFAFIEQIVGYPIREFFDRNTQTIRTEVEGILKDLLTPS
ncbi:MAG: hypothetical protein ACOYOZ_16990 [Pirellula sp.]